MIEPPEEGGFVWDVFWELRNCQPTGMSGPERINFRELQAWQDVRGYRLDNAIVDMILKMDTAFMAEWHRQDRKTKKAGRKGK